MPAAYYKTSFKAYKRSKITLLRDFGIHLSEVQKERFDALKTEKEVDAFCRNLIFNKLDKSNVQPLPNRNALN